MAFEQLCNNFQGGAEIVLVCTRESVRGRELKREREKESQKGRVRERERVRNREREGERESQGRGTRIHFRRF